MKNHRRRGAKWLAAAASVIGCGRACDGPLGDQFRDAAGPELESGIRSILNGLVDGGFAVYDPADSSETGATGNTG
jgi:hypothetical protein